MKKKLVRKEIGDSAFFNYVIDQKFKHNYLSVHFILPLAIETASVNALVPLLLSKGSKNLPDFSALNAELNRLYGANLITNISQFNGYQRVGLGISFLDNRFALEDENLVELCSKLLLDLIFEPNFDDKGIFSPKQVALEKQELIDAIESEINDKRSYALFRATEEMCKNEPISVSKYGTLETATAITPEAVSASWKNMLETAQVQIMFTGSGNPASAVQLFENVFQNLERNPIDYKLLKLATTVDKVNEVTEQLDGLEQGKLVMGMRIDGLNSTEETNAARLFAAMYGGTPFSKLFLNVRERLSLCYYCAARLSTLNNIVTVDSGVESQNVQKAKEEIVNQLESIKNGNITDEEIKNTKLLLCNSIENTNDSLGGIEGWYLSQIIQGKDTSPEEDIENINKITKEQIVAAAQGVRLDTVYLLAGKENN